MRNTLSKSEPFDQTVMSFALDGSLIFRTTDTQLRLSSRLYDVSPPEPYGKGDRVHANSQEFRTWQIRTSVGNSSYLTGPYPQRIVTAGADVYPHTDSSDGALGFSERTTLCENVCIPKLLRRIGDSSLQLAVSLAESRQSASMIAQALKSVVFWKRSATSLLKDLAKPLRNGSKRAANAWLEHVYGWVPLMQDVYGCATYHSTFLLERGIKVRHTVTEPVNRFETADFWNRSVTGYVSTRLEMYRRIRVTNTQLFDAQRLGLLNPLSTAWELLPYSFVADWFIDIGGYLQGLETACGLGYDVVDGYDSYSELVQTNTRITMSQRARDDFGYLSHHGAGSYRGSWKKRSVTTAVPLPRPPAFSVKLGASRIISAGALVRQLF